ncbi:MAG: response regulator transcription factor [Pseudomonadota bacterium]|nr:response regulator transcription factor [Pseudomonadota bacterium]
MARFLIADDHPLFREAVCLLLGQLEKGAVCCEAASLEEATGLLESSGPFDLILLDLNMPGSDALSGLRVMHSLTPDTPIAIISHFEDGALIEQGIACGAVGYIPKSLSHDAILQALQTILAGGVYLPPGAEQRICLKNPAGAAAQPQAQSLMESLTPRQRAVLDLLARGRANKQIADELAISEWTVKAHISAILRKLGAQSRLEAVVIARQLNPAGLLV